MRSLILVATLTINLLLVQLVESNEYPPGLGLTHEQKSRENLGKWILGMPYSAKLSIDQELFRRFNYGQINPTDTHTPYSPKDDYLQVISDQTITVRDAINAIFLPLNFHPDFRDAPTALLEMEMSLTNEIIRLSDVMTYIEYISGLHLTIYPREAGGLVIVRRKL